MTRSSPRLGPMAFLARHELRLLGRDPVPFVLLLVLPLAIMWFFRPALALALFSEGYVRSEGAEQAVPGIATTFSLFLVGFVGLSFFRDRSWRTWERLRTSPIAWWQLFAGKLCPIHRVVGAARSTLPCCCSSIWRSAGRCGRWWFWQRSSAARRSPSVSPSWLWREPWNRSTPWPTWDGGHGWPGRRAGAAVAVAGLGTPRRAGQPGLLGDARLSLGPPRWRRDGGGRGPQRGAHRLDDRPRRRDARSVPHDARQTVVDVNRPGDAAARRRPRALTRRTARQAPRMRC